MSAPCVGLLLIKTDARVHIRENYCGDMVDLVNNVVALRINSRDRINISDSTTDFTVALRKSLRNIAAINVAGVVIPRNDTLIGPNNDTLTGEIYINDAGLEITNPFEVSITRTNYTASTLATELAAVLNANTDMLAYGITFAVSYVSLTNRMSIVATYPFGATKIWSITIDFSGLRDVVGIGAAGTTAQTFTATAGSATLTIPCPRAPSLVRALTYNITSNVLTNAINTSYISSLGKQFQVTSAIDQLNVESKFIVAATNIAIPPPDILPELFSNMNIGTSVSLSNSGTTMAVGSRRYGAYIFNRSSVLDPWVLSDSSPIRATAFLYNDQGKYVALSGDAAILAFSSYNAAFIYVRSGVGWASNALIARREPRLIFNIDGSTLAGSTLEGSGVVFIFIRALGSWVEQELTNPPGSVKFGSSGVGLSNTGDNLVTGDAQFGSVIAYVYLRVSNVWALQQTLVPAGAVGGFIDGVTFSGNGLYLAISSSTDNAGVGATWIYNWTGATWNLQQTLTVASTSLAMNIVGDTIVIGASTGAGKVNVYKRAGALWSLELTDYVGTGGSGSANQGASVSITGAGDDIIWGGPADFGVYGDNQGAVWSAHRTVATWAQTLGKVTSTIGVAQPIFGTVIAMSDDGKTIAVGVPDAGFDAGIAYIYVNSGIEWVLQSTFDPRPGLNQRVGEAVAISNDGNTFAFSAHINNIPGTAFVYTRTAGVWTLQAELVSTSPLIGQGYRIALSGSGDTLVESISQFGSADGLIIWNRFANAWSEVVVNFGAGVFGGNLISRVDIDDAGSTIVASSAGFGAVVYKLISGAWTQMGANFISFYTPVVATAQFGTYCCISADGNTVAISDPNDDANNGVVFIFKNVANVWVQNAALTGPDPSPPSNQGYAIALINNGDTCIFSSPTYTQPFVDLSGATWAFNYNGVSWSSTPITLRLGYGYGHSVSGQRTGLNYAVGMPNSSSPGARLIGQVIVYSAAGTEYSLTSQILVPLGSYSIFDMVNLLNDLLGTAIPTGLAGSSVGYSVTFDGVSKLTITPNLGFPVTSISFRVSTSSTFNIARWPSQEYKTAQVSNPVVFAINNDVIKSITTHSDNSDNVLVDNTPDTPYRKYPAGYTIDADTPIDIQLRNDRDQIIDLNGSDWVMTVYATVRS